jgi:hypothetical protein
MQMTIRVSMKRASTPHTISALVAWMAVLVGSACVQARAQQPCLITVPVNVMMPDGALVRHLSQDTFIASDKGEPLRIESLTEDSGPRRIILIAENGKRVSAAARKLEGTILSQILSKARTEDSLALLTAGGPRIEIPFGADRGVLKEAVERLGNPAKGKGQTSGALDAVSESIGWFQQTKPSDAIVVVAMNIEEDHVVRFSKARSALEAAGVRLFCFQLGRIPFEYYGPGVWSGTGWAGFPEDTVTPHRDNAFALTTDTGGAMLLEDTTGGMLEGYKLDDERVRIVSHLAEQLSRAVTEYYSVAVEAPSREFTVDLAAAIRQKLPKAQLLYPRHPPTCSSAAR